MVLNDAQPRQSWRAILGGFQPPPPMITKVPGEGMAGPVKAGADRPPSLQRQQVYDI